MGEWLKPAHWKCAEGRISSFPPTKIHMNIEIRDNQYKFFNKTFLPMDRNYFLSELERHARRILSKFLPPKYDIDLLASELEHVWQLPDPHYKRSGLDKLITLYSYELFKQVIHKEINRKPLNDAKRIANNAKIQFENYYK